MKNYYEELSYNEDLLDYIQAKVSIIGIIDAYFKAHSKEHSLINKDALLQVRIENKFFYDCCPFHYNTPNLFTFSVSENCHLCYCYGCGFSGSVFEFVMEAYNLDINEATKLLGSFIGIFNINQLSQRLMNVYNELIINYKNKDILVEESKKKTSFLTDRVDRYLDNMDLENIDFKRVANRLSCSKDFVEERYKQTEHYKQKCLILERQTKLERIRREFN